VTLWFVRGFQGRLPKQVPSPAPLMGFFKDRPSIDKRPVSPLPVARSPRLPHLAHVPLLPFLPASAVYSSRVCAGLLHPAADHGVRPVSGREPTSIAEAMGCRSPTVLTDVTPFEAFPSAQSGTVSLRHDWHDHHRPSPLAVSPVGRQSGPTGLNLRGLTRCRVRCSTPAVADEASPMLPWDSSTRSLRCRGEPQNTTKWCAQWPKPH
jgi:hypothetical protein